MTSSWSIFIQLSVPSLTTMIKINLRPVCLYNLDLSERTNYNVMSATVQAVTAYHIRSTEQIYTNNKGAISTRWRVWLRQAGKCHRKFSLT
jgi:hypothetical protein